MHSCYIVILTLAILLRVYIYSKHFELKKKIENKVQFTHTKHNIHLAVYLLSPHQHFDRMETSLYDTSHFELPATTLALMCVIDLVSDIIQ